jgi:hypothetical protein
MRWPTMLDPITPVPIQPIFVFPGSIVGAAIAKLLPSRKRAAGLFQTPVGVGGFAGEIVCGLRRKYIAGNSRSHLSPTTLAITISQSDDIAEFGMRIADFTCESSCAVGRGPRLD